MPRRSQEMALFELPKLRGTAIAAMKRSADTGATPAQVHFVARPSESQDEAQIEPKSPPPKP